MTLELRGLTKRFGDIVAVDGLDLRVEEGEFLTLLGPSGCGKTTVLRSIAGLETPDRGEVLFRGEEISALSPQRRGFGMVFQHYALFPHLTVSANVAFGLRARREPADRIAERVESSLALVGLEGYGTRRVQELSGGQQQRVALARALAIRPPLLLLDEPLSNLDAALRERTRGELRLLVKELGITAVFVTHDQEEAFDLADRVAVLEAGRLRQIGRPEELYDRPADRFVATFVGRSNTLAGRLSDADGERVTIELDRGATWQIQLTGRVEAAAGGRVVVIARPEGLEILGPEAASADPAALEGTIRDRRYRGAVTSYRIDIGEDRLLQVDGDPDLKAPIGRCGVRPRRGARIHLFAEEEEG